MEPFNTKKRSGIIERWTIMPLQSGPRTIAIFEAHNTDAGFLPARDAHLHRPRVELLADDVRGLPTTRLAW
jgi:hypothetical protein